MKSYKEFVEDAIQNYAALPPETNDLYKKYFVHIPFDDINVIEQVDINKHEADLEKFSKSITENTRIKFDAIISGHATKSFNQAIRISKNGEVDAKVLEKKMFKSTEDKFAAFANAHSKHFLFIDVEEGASKRLNLLFMNKGNLPVQIFVNAKKNSKLEIFELFASDSNSKSLVSVLHEISAQKNSDVEVNVLHNENENTHVVNLCKGIAEDDAKLRANFMYSGGIVTKSKGFVDSAGVNSQVNINEFAFGSKNQKFDLGTYIVNSKPKSAAFLESGTVLDGNAQCMLKGYAKVSKGTKGCVSRITERGILLSKDAHIDALPDMSIDYSNEVKATHSAATAPIDEEALFYLESRGLEEKAARRIFITAFVAKYVSNIKDGIASAVAMSVMLNRLENGALGVIPEVTTTGIWMAR